MLPPTLNTNEFDIKNLVIKPSEIPITAKQTKYIIFVNYKYGDKIDKLNFTTGDIEFLKGGIPPLDDKYNKTDKNRDYVLIGQDPKTPNQGVTNLFNDLKKIDEHFNKELITNKNKNGFLQRKANGEIKNIKVESYSPCIRMITGSEENPNPAFVPYELLRIDFAREYVKANNDNNDAPLTKLQTLVFPNLETNTPLDIQTPTELSQYIGYKGVYRFNFVCTKISVTTKAPHAYRCSLSFKLNEVYIVRMPQSATKTRVVMNRFAKQDAELINSMVAKQPEKTSDKTSNKSSSETKSEQKPDPDSGSSTSESDDAPASAQGSASDSESSVKSEKKTTKKGKTTAKKAKESSSDSESSSDKKPPPPPKEQTKKKTKK